MHGNLQLHLDAREQESERHDMAGQIAKLHEQIQLLDLIHDAVILRDMEGTIIFWNRGAEEMYGWTRTEAMGMISHVLLRTQFPQSLEQTTTELLRNERWEGELLQTKSDGSGVVISSR